MSGSGTFETSGNVRSSVAMRDKQTSPEHAKIGANDPGCVKTLFHEILAAVILICCGGSDEALR
jgi:hypothetical protein